MLPGNDEDASQGRQSLLPGVVSPRAERRERDGSEPGADISVEQGEHGDIEMVETDTQSPGEKKPGPLMDIFARKSAAHTSKKKKDIDREGQAGDEGGHEVEGKRHGPAKTSMSRIQESIMAAFANPAAGGTKKEQKQDSPEKASKEGSDDKDEEGKGGFRAKQTQMRNMASSMFGVFTKKSALEIKRRDRSSTEECEAEEARSVEQRPDSAEPDDAGGVNAALQSSSPTGTSAIKSADNKSVDGEGQQGPRSLPAESPARSPLASTLSLPDKISSSSRFKNAATTLTAANKFKRGAKKKQREIEVPAMVIEGQEEAYEDVDFRQTLEQAENGLLRELHRENRLLWKLDQAGVLQEINTNFRNHVKKSAAMFEFIDFDYSNEEQEEPVVVMQERYVRCFVSAPYSDMQAERRLLAQEVFPTIRQRCMELGVSFMECDFCWGVPENIAERKSNIMERMIEMRQNIKTYIIGLVAERYGYAYLLDATPGHLAQDPLFVGKRAAVLGLQEIELDEGPLARDIPHAAFYYFRDSQYLDGIEDTQLRGTLQSEGLLSRERLSHLKAKLRLSNVPIRYNYKNPEEFATLALADLTAKIVEDFPAETTKEMLMEVDKNIVREFEESTLKIFEGREETMSALDDRVLAVQTHPGPTIVVGEAGVGKSAFLVAWNRRFQTKHSYDFMYKHYAGLNTESGCWTGIVRGIMQGMKDKFDLRKEIPNETSHLPGSLSLWLGISASLERRVIIMIDAVDRVHDVHIDPELESPPASDDEDDDDYPLERQPRLKPPHDLFWLPTIVPPNVRLVVSVTEGTDAHAQLIERRWGTFKLDALDDESRKVIVSKFMRARGLDMPEGVSKKLLERGPFKKPLVLVSLLRSLQHPDDMTPSGPLGTFLYARGIQELASMMLDRLENFDGLQERRGLVEEVLSCVALSRRGLSEPEIVGMMQVPRALFTKFYVQTRSLFKVFFGLMSFTSFEFDLEVRRRYLVHEEIVIMIRNRIASYFMFRPLTTRTVEEVPWQYFQSRRWTDLSSILSNPDVFMILTNSKAGLFDLIVYWESLTLDPHEGGGGVKIVDKMEDCVRRAKESRFPTHEQIALLLAGADILKRLQFYDISMTFFRRACDLEEREIGLSAISKIEYMLQETRVFLQKGDFSATRRMYEKTLKALTDLVDTDGDGNITYEELKATDAGTLLLDTEEELMFMLYEGQYYSSLEDMCLHMLGRDEDRPTNELLLFDVLINTYLETGKLDSAKDFIARALKVIPNQECDEYTHVLSRKLGICLMRGDYFNAIEIVEDSGWIWEAIDGGDQENLDEILDIMGFYCCALSQSGRAEDAVRILKIAVGKQFPPEDEEDGDSSSSSSDSETSSVVLSVSDAKRNMRAERVNVVVTDVMMLDLLGIAQREIYEAEDAEASHKKALSLKVLSFGPKDTSNAFTLSELAALYENKRDKVLALKMRKASCAIIKESLGGKNARYYMALQAEAACHWKFGDFQEARHLAKVVQGGIEQSFGSRSEMLPSTLVLMGLILTSIGELREAEKALTRSFNLSTIIWGEGCVAASNATFALALVEERKGQFEQAELKLKQTMQAREDKIGPLHSYLQQDMAATSLLYYRIEAYQEVEELLRNSLPAMQAVHGPEALCVAGILSLLALVHARVGNVVNGVQADPVALLLRALRIRRKLYGPSAAVNQHEMLTALVFAHLGEHKRAEKLFRKSYVRATTFRKTPHAVRWLLHKHLVRSGNLGYEAADRPKLPEWTPDYTDLTVDLENLFDRMDINKNGSLSRNELRAGLIDAGYEAEDVVKRLPLLFKSMDRNEDGRISKYEFILHFDSHDKLLSPVYERGTLDNAVNMGRLFDRVDTDKNGLLSRNELHDALMQEGYEFEDIVQRLPRLFSTMDNDGDGKITKAEFVSHFDVYKGFSPIGSPSRSPARKPPGGSSTSPPRQVQSPTVDIVDKVVGGIQAATEARERAEAQEAAHDVESEATGKRQQSAGSHRSSWRPGSEDSDEKEQDQGPAGPLTGGVAVYHAGLVATMDFGVDRITPSVPVSRPVSGHQIEGFEASATIARSRGVSASSSTIGSSIGTEDAREELDKLGRNAVEMVDDIFLDVIGSFPSPMESVTEFRTPQVLDNEIPGAGKLLRPLSAPGVGRKPSRLMELVSGARRPQTAGPVRHHSALKAAIRATALEDDGDEESAQDAVPRLSISAVGRARERRRLDAIDARDDAGNTSLHSAARDNDVEAVKSLLEAGANAAAANKIGEAPIHTAARAGNLRMVKLLASAVPNINQPGPEGRTALHFAVESGSLGLVQTLCETFGSDIAYQTNSGETAAQLAVRVLGSYAPVARYLSGLMTSLPAI